MQQHTCLAQLRAHVRRLTLLAGSSQSQLTGLLHAPCFLPQVLSQHSIKYAHPSWHGRHHRLQVTV
jgi:hypothetical protein